MGKNKDLKNGLVGLGAVGYIIKKKMSSNSEVTKLTEKDIEYINKNAIFLGIPFNPKHVFEKVTEVTSKVVKPITVMHQEGLKLFTGAATATAADAKKNPSKYIEVATHAAIAAAAAGKSIDSHTQKTYILRENYSLRRTLHDFYPEVFFELNKKLEEVATKYNLRISNFRHYNDQFSHQNQYKNSHIAKATDEIINHMKNKINELAKKQNAQVENKSIEYQSKNLLIPLPFSPLPSLIPVVEKATKNFRPTEAFFGKILQGFGDDVAKNPDKYIKLSLLAAGAAAGARSKSTEEKDIEVLKTTPNLLKCLHIASPKYYHEYTNLLVDTAKKYGCDIHTGDVNSAHLQEEEQNKYEAIVTANKTITEKMNDWMKKNPPHKS